jgi:hypothetical protein
MAGGIGERVRMSIIVRVKRRSPQEKKELSYARDGRNAQGENDKASRKGIRRRKSQRARATRRLANQQLPKNVDEVLVEQAEDIDRAIGTAKHKYNWRKKPDIPLRDWVARQQRRRNWRAQAGRRSGR